MGTHALSVFLVATEPSGSSRLSLRCVGFNRRRIYRHAAYEYNNSLILVENDMNNDNGQRSSQVSNVSYKYQENYLTHLDRFSKNIQIWNFIVKWERKPTRCNS